MSRRSPAPHPRTPAPTTPPPTTRTAASLALATPAARGKTLTAFERRCIRAGTLRLDCLERNVNIIFGQLQYTFLLSKAPLCVAPRANSSAIHLSSRLAGPAPRRSRCSRGLIHGLLALAVLATAPPLGAQHHTTNPFRPVYGWGTLPEGREWGSVSAIEIAPDGNIWVAERCGRNSCVGSELDPVLLFDTDGNLLGSFGAGLLAWPHGIDVDHEGNVWITDAWTNGATATGHAVLKFSPEGELLMTIGTPGEAGDPPTHLTRPSDVVVAPSGQIYVVDAHDRTKGRVIRYAADGTHVETWGELGYGPKQFRDPHALAMDSQGRIFVGDRWNNRIQIFDQDGNFVAIWTQFGRPSGLYIDADDNIYVADSESSPAPNEFMGQRNAGWEKGIRIGDARMGWVHHFLPDDRANVMGFSGPEGVVVDRDGNVYGAEVSQRRITKWVRFRR